MTNWILDLAVIIVEAKKNIDVVSTWEDYDFLSYNDKENTLYVWPFHYLDFAKSEIKKKVFSGIRLTQSIVDFYKFDKIVIRDCHFVHQKSADLGFVDIYNCDQKRITLSFENCIFDVRFSINDSRFKKIEIDHCIFNDSVLFHKIDVSQNILIRKSKINAGIESIAVADKIVYVNSDVKNIIL